MTDKEIDSNEHLKDLKFICNECHFSCSWINSKGEHPEEFSLVNENNVVENIKDALDGKWVFVNERLRKMARECVIANSKFFPIIVYF
jgi:hypothetical protein